MHVFRFLCLLLSQLLCCSSSSNQFERVDSCPESSKQWTNRDQRKNCRQFQATPDFMCAAIEGKPGVFGEICTIVGLSTAGKCAVLDADTYNLNFISCYWSPGCPTTAYRASDIYKYQACYGNFYRVETTTPNKASSTLHVNENTTIVDSTSKEQKTVTIVIVTLIVYVLILSLSLIILFLIRKKRMETEHSKSFEKVLFLNPITEADKDTAKALKCLTTLANYLRCRIVALCDETSLRNKLLIHSESMKENLGEKTVTQLMSCNLNELMKSSLNIIYMLLTKFCDIPTPRRGWGYRPDDDDKSLGADIERIKTFINEYVDTRKCYLKEMEIVAKRLHSKYGDINNEIKSDFSKESIIKYVEIKPDCIEDNGTVVTGSIKQMFNHLETKGIAICVGSIGCGKTTAMEYVSKRYKEKGWKIEWCESLIEKSRIGYNQTMRKTFVCCDNVFGRFGCEVFTKHVFTDFENIIRRMLKQGENEIKVLLGIHVHVLDEFKSLGCYDIFQDKSAIIDMDSLSNSEILLIYQLQQMRNNHAKEFASFEGILDLLANRSDSVGTPFQTWMISKIPDDFGRKEFCNKPFEQLSEYFKKMFIKDREAFYTLIYIMCVIIYSKENDIDHSVSGAIDAFFDKNAIDFHLKDLIPFTLEDEKTVELGHELIGIALFHVFFEVMKSPWSIFKACDIEITLGLTRPADGEGHLHRFAVSLSKDLFEQTASILRNKLIESKTEYKDHPLMDYYNQQY